MKIDFKIKRILRTGIIITSIMMAAILILSFFDRINSETTDEQSSSIDLQNFDIEKITTEDITKSYSHNIAFMTSKKMVGEKSGVDNMRISDFDYDNCSFSAKKVTGIVIISATKAKDCRIEFVIDTNLISGKAKVAIVKGNELVEYIEIGKQTKLTYDVNGEHTFVIKAICEEAEFKISVSRTQI